MKRARAARPKIIEKEARIIRLIFSFFLAGMTSAGIASHLIRAMEVLTPGGKQNWQASTAKSILTNEKYKGAALLQKTYVTDFFTKTTKVNQGEVQQYYIENSHKCGMPHLHEEDVKAAFISIICWEK